VALIRTYREPIFLAPFPWSFADAGNRHWIRLRRAAPCSRLCSMLPFRKHLVAEISVGDFGIRVTAPNGRSRAAPLLKALPLDGEGSAVRCRSGTTLRILSVTKPACSSNSMAANIDSLSQQEADRSRFLQSEGYRVLRFWNDEVLENSEGVHAIIVENVRQPHPHPTLPHRGGGL